MNFLKVSHLYKVPLESPAEKHSLLLEEQIHKSGNMELSFIDASERGVKRPDDLTKGQELECGHLLGFR